MSRSRRKHKLGKCFCGLGFIPYVGMKHKGKQVADCPVLQFPHQENDRRSKFRKRREELSAEISSYEPLNVLHSQGKDAEELLDL